MADFKKDPLRCTYDLMVAAHAVLTDPTVSERRKLAITESIVRVVADLLYPTIDEDLI